MAFPQDNLNDDEEVVMDRHPSWTFMLGPGLLLFITFVICLVFLLLPIVNTFWWAGLIIFALGAASFGINFLRWRTIQFVVTTDRIITRVGIIAKSGTEIPLDRVMNISYRQSIKERILGVGDLVIESAGENGQQYFSDVHNPSAVQNTIYRQTEIYSQRGPNNGMGDESPSVTRGAHRGGQNRNRGSQEDREQERIGGKTGMNGSQGLGERNQSPVQRSRDDDDDQGGGSVDIPAQIEALDRLRQRGILTDDEFRAKKQQLLDRI